MLKDNALIEKLKRCIDLKLKGFSKEDVIRKEKIIIDSKNEIEYLIIKSPRKYLVETRWNSIVLTEDSTQLFSKEELKSVLLHEKGHTLFTTQYFLSFLISWLLTTRIFLLLVAPFTPKMDLLFGLFVFAMVLFIFLIISTISKWLLELRCDLYAIKNSNKILYITALQKHYIALGYDKRSLLRKIKGYGTHPPLPIRIALLNYV